MVELVEVEGGGAFQMKRLSKASFQVVCLAISSACLFVLVHGWVHGE